MLLATLLFAVTQAAPAVPQTDCEAALARGTSTATAQVCLAEAEFVQAQTVQRNSAAWTRHLEAAATLYKRALALPSDEVIKSTAIERLLVIFDQPMLNNSTEMVNAFGELIALKPTELDPLFRYAAYQERQGSVEDAEQTLLAARRVQPAAIDPFKMLARFYARRASALYANANTQDAQEQTPPATPDKNGVYQVGGGLTPPRRLGNPIYPPDATAAGITGAVAAEITVSESGIVTAARVLNSVPVLDEAALEAVKEWRYDPTIVNGKPVPVKMKVTVNFSLSR